MPKSRTDPFTAAVGTVDGRRDLVDFFPVFLDLKQLLALFPPASQYTYELKHESGRVNVVFTPFVQADAGKYQRDFNAAGQILNEFTRRVTAAGLPVANDFLNQIASENKGVILVEGRGPDASDKPLVLSVKRPNGQVVWEVKMPLKLSRVEQMFRHLNLRDGKDAPENLPGLAKSGDAGDPSRMDEPSALPDSLSNGRWLVFVHGYNVNAQASRAWEAEMFKRFYWSGSNAKFIGVDWRGNPTGPLLVSRVVPDYHLASMNSFASAEKLAGILNSISSEPKTVIGHSMGALLAAFALNNFSMQANHACLVDAAIASECFDGEDAEQIDLMAYAPWTQTANPSVPNYPRELWAADWHKRFMAGDDARQTLTWKDNFTDLIPTVHNFYSSTEDVLATLPGTPNDTVIYNVLHLDFSRHAWVVQEKAKGNVATLFNLVALTGTDYGGWGFNLTDPLPPPPEPPTDPVWYQLEIIGPPDYWSRRVATPAEIGPVTPTLLDGVRRSPLFKTGWGRWNLTDGRIRIVDETAIEAGCPDWIVSLYKDATGSAIAADPVKRVQLLSQAIPALSTPVGQKNLASLAEAGRNYNMPEMFISQGHWPRDFDQNLPLLRMWWHSDIREVAYLYCFGVFDAITQISNQ